MSPTLEKLDIESLTPDERLELIGILWDSLDQSSAVRAVPEWHLEIVKRRAAELEADPGSAIPLEEVMRRLSEEP